jgi:hypothetical protein
LSAKADAHVLVGHVTTVAIGMLNKPVACFRLLIPDYSRCVGVKIEKACFDWGIVPSLWFRQFTHDVN